MAAFGYRNFRTIRISGESMEPTFRSGQLKVMSDAYWLFGPIRKNDIVVIEGEQPGEYLVKRVYALEGERVNVLLQPYGWRLDQGEYRVPKDSVYVLGDNWLVSEDSRRFGAVPIGRIKGKVLPWP